VAVTTFSPIVILIFIPSAFLFDASFVCAGGGPSAVLFPAPQAVWLRDIASASANNVNLLFAGFFRLIKDEFKNISSTFVLPVGDLLHPLDDTTFERLPNGEV
jgi:hypothetical protein